ncbi:hypothetical protein A2U01_0096667, partial [Trifolium medium]|nr:hypothetical protein [Trifolium medium]
METLMGHDGADSLLKKKIEIEIGKIRRK